VSKRGYLTAAEYKALRQTLGMTQQEAADFHRVQGVLTIKRWEKGTSWVSEIACDRIVELFNKINTTISAAVHEYEKSAQKGEVDVVLIIYPDSCYQKFVVGIGDLPNSVHKAMISRLYAELKKRGVKVGIVEFNPQDYFTFLAQNGFSDGQDVRAAWAVDYRGRLLLN